MLNAAAAAAVPDFSFAVQPHPVNLQLYRWVLIAHGSWRWVVLIAGFAVVISALLRLGERRPWAPEGPRLGKFFGIAVDIQVLLGAALYLLFSPLTTIVAGAARTKLPAGSEAYYFAAVHPAIMLGAFVAVHVSAILVGRAHGDAAHQRRAVIFYGVTLVILLSGIPWWRPWLRL